MKFIAGLMMATVFLVFQACDSKPSPNETTDAAFSATGYDRAVPASVYFINTSSKATSYLWDFGDGTISTEQNPTHTYNNIGTYYLKLKATGPNGVDSVCKVLYFGDTNDPSKSAFSYFMDRCTGTPVNFSFYSINPNSIYYSWDFDNGGTSLIKNPIIMYSSPGNYMIKFSSQINGVRDTVELGIQIN